MGELMSGIMMVTLGTVVVGLFSVLGIKFK